MWFTYLFIIAVAFVKADKKDEGKNFKPKKHKKYPDYDQFKKECKGFTDCFNCTVSNCQWHTDDESSGSDGSHHDDESTHGDDHPHNDTNTTDTNSTNIDPAPAPTPVDVVNTTLLNFHRRLKEEKPKEPKVKKNKTGHCSSRGKRNFDKLDSIQFIGHTCPDYLGVCKVRNASDPAPAPEPTPIPDPTNTTDNSTSNETAEAYLAPNETTSDALMFSMDFTKNIPQNYFCYWEQISMNATDWEIDRNATDGVTTYLF